MENAVKKIALALATTAILGFAAPAFAAESDSGTKVAASQSGAPVVRLDYSAVAPDPNPSRTTSRSTTASNDALLKGVPILVGSPTAIASPQGDEAIQGF
jgi:hypothetical protein